MRQRAAVAMQQARMLLRRAAAALAPGGLVAVLEPIRARRPSQFAALLNLHYFLASRGCRFTPETLTAWVAEADCTSVRSRSLRRAPGMSLFSAYRR